MTTKALPYRINGRDEETTCDTCGGPLDHGDGAFQIADFNWVVCSRRCAEALTPRDPFRLLV